MAKIQTLKNKDDVIIYPQTHGMAVFVNEGELLQDKIESYLVSEEVGEVEDVNVTAELTSNKVTSIGDTSTDLQYPSAKAVYDAIIANKEVGIKIEVVTTLPEIGDSKIIYLINNNSNEGQNIYDEYIYANGWEKIGTTKVDLSNYATKDYVNNVITSSITTALEANY